MVVGTDVETPRTQSIFDHGVRNLMHEIKMTRKRKQAREIRYNIFRAHPKTHKDQGLGTIDEEAELGTIDEEAELGTIDEEAEQPMHEEKSHESDEEAEQPMENFSGPIDEE